MQICWNHTNCRFDFKWTSMSVVYEHCITCHKFGTYWKDHKSGRLVSCVQFHMMIGYFGMRVDFCLLVNSCCGTHYPIIFQLFKIKINMKTSSDLFFITKNYSPKKMRPCMKALMMIIHAFLLLISICVSTNNCVKFNHTEIEYSFSLIVHYRQSMVGMTQWFFFFCEMLSSFSIFKTSLENDNRKFRNILRT